MMNRYPCRIENEAQIYDGDTIKDVRIEVNIPSLEVGFYLIRDIRIFGIDTPEKRPKRAGRSAESLANEKRAAAASRAFLISILEQNDFRFEIEDLDHGKYAGRVLAEIWVKDKNVSELMITAGHAKPYDGGKKPDWNF